MMGSRSLRVEIASGDPSGLPFGNLGGDPSGGTATQFDRGRKFALPYHLIDHRTGKADSTPHVVKSQDSL
jgi:hypothetical protein